MAAPDYSVIIPVYNSTRSIEHLAQRIDAVFATLSKSYELILVDDASPNPETWPVIEALCHAKPAQIRAVQHQRNFGQHAAFFCGIERAKGHHLITMDDDGEHLPEAIPLLIAQQQHDVVMAYPKGRRQTLSNRLTSYLKMRCENYIFRTRSQLHISAFSLFSRAIAQDMVQLRSPFPLLSAMQLFVTRDVVNVEVPTAERMESVSGYNFFKRMHLFFSLLFNHSSLLLRLIGVVGIGMAVVSVVMALWIIIQKLTGQVGIVGWASLMASNLLFHGLVLFSIGVLGEYLVRIISAVEHKPTYIVRRSVNLYDA